MGLGEDFAVYFAAGIENSTARRLLLVKNILIRRINVKEATSYSKAGNDASLSVLFFRNYFKDVDTSTFTTGQLH